MDVKTTYALFRLKSVQKSLQSWQLVSMYLFYYSNEFIVCVWRVLFVHDNDHWD